MLRRRRAKSLPFVVTTISCNPEGCGASFAVGRLLTILNQRPSKRCWSDTATPVDDRDLNESAATTTEPGSSGDD